jgi:hypothetical protein
MKPVMNNLVIFYLQLLAAGVLLAVTWLALRDMLYGKKFRLHSSSNKQKSVLSPKTAWLQFGYRSAIYVVVLLPGIYAHSPLIIILKLLSFVLPIVILTKMLRLAKLQTASTGRY